MATNGTVAATDRSTGSVSARVDWVDYAKGICIIMVVMVHAVLESVRLISDACLAFNDNCAVGIEPNEAKIRENLY